MTRRNTSLKKYLKFNCIKRRIIQRLSFIKQLPFQTYIGIILISIPLLIVFKSYPIYKLMLISICWHVGITIPILSLMSYYWNWNSIDENSMQSYKKPIFLMTLSLGIVYPMIWGTFLSLNRYFRLGTTYNIYNMLLPWQDYIIFVLFVMPYIILWGLFFINSIKAMKTLLWEYFEGFIYTLHISALQNGRYFAICRVIHKTYFVIYDFIMLYPGAFYKRFDPNITAPLTVKITSFFRYKHLRRLINCLMLIIIFIEITFYKGNLYFSLYILFLYPAFLGVINICKSVGGQDLIYNVCYSDYINRNIETPRYRMKFYFLLEKPALWYPIQIDIPKILNENIQKNIKKYSKAYNQFTYLEYKLGFAIHGFRPNPSSQYVLSYPKKFGILYGLPKPYWVRLKAQYKIQYGVRWFHTTSVLHAPPQPLPEIRQFVNLMHGDGFQLFAASLRFKSINFEQAASAFKWVFPNPNTIYKMSPKILVHIPKTLKDFQEIDSAVTYGQFLSQHNIVSGTYQPMKDKYGYPNMEAMQMRPDLLSWWQHNVSFMFKGYLGIDEKYQRASNYGRNQLISGITPTEYQELLKNFAKFLEKKHGISLESMQELNSLGNPKLTFDEYMTLWSSTVHLYPRNCKPPLRAKSTFDKNHLSAEGHTKFEEADYNVDKIAKKIGLCPQQTKTAKQGGEFPDEALNNFEDSFMHKMS